MRKKDEQMVLLTNACKTCLSTLSPLSLRLDSSLFKWTELLLHIGVSVKNQMQNTGNVDPDETIRYEPSLLDLHCLQKYLSWSTGGTLRKHAYSNILKVLPAK